VDTVGSIEILTNDANDANDGGAIPSPIRR
jgi:hypothetical protein